MNAPPKDTGSATACPYCGNSTTKLYCHGRTGSIVRCLGCDGLFNPDRSGEIEPDAVSGDQVRREYIDTYRNNEPAEQAIAQDVLQLLRTRMPTARRLLELGCGNAAIGAAAVACYPDLIYTGMELSPVLYGTINPAIRDRILHDVTAEVALKNVPDSSQDIVILHHVLEHLPEPRQTLAIVRSKLASGGRLFIEVPNEQWKRPIIRLRRMLKRSADDWFPGHINFFTQHTLRSFLVSQGFEIEYLQKVPAGRYLDMVKKMLGGEAAFRSNLPARAAHAVLRWTQLEALVGYGIVLRCICQPETRAE